MNYAVDDNFDEYEFVPGQKRRCAGVILPPPGMCFTCHAEKPLPGQIECLQCSVKAELKWVGYQRLV